VYFHENEHKFTIAKYVFYGAMNQVALSRANMGYGKGDISCGFGVFLDPKDELSVIGCRLLGVFLYSFWRSWPS
jgi:hypothetical protein